MIQEGVGLHTEAAGVGTIIFFPGKRSMKRDHTRCSGHSCNQASNFSRCSTKDFGRWG